MFNFIWIKIINNILRSFVFQVKFNHISSFKFYQCNSFSWFYAAKVFRVLSWQQFPVILHVLFRLFSCNETFYSLHACSSNPLTNIRNTNWFFLFKCQLDTLIRENAKFPFFLAFDKILFHNFISHMCQYRNNLIFSFDLIYAEQY